MSSNLLKATLRIAEKNGELLTRVRDFSHFVSRLRESSSSLELNFRARCLERLYVLMTLTADNCSRGMPVAATLMARGVIETVGLIVLFESKMTKVDSHASKQRLDIVKQFVFATKKFGAQKKAVHVLDCVRAIKPRYPDIELLYDILCESVHPNWLGVSQFKEFRVEEGESEEHNHLLYATVFQSLLLAHRIVEKLKLPSVADSTHIL